MHGELNAVYETLAYMQAAHGVRGVDLVVCCGDFQAARDPSDLAYMSVPAHYRRLGDFSDYYHGLRTAPVPTLFIGGNHEAAAHLWALYHGGWAARNVFYLGHAGVVRFGPLRIAGASGIYKPYDYRRGYSAPSLSQDWVRSAYHVREFEIFRLLQVSRPVDVFLSHDWPAGVVRHGDTTALL
jgi:lariat debranching enzyme